VGTGWGLAGRRSWALAAMRAWRDLWETWQSQHSRAEGPVADAGKASTSQLCDLTTSRPLPDAGARTDVGLCPGGPREAGMLTPTWPP
jgi:hypothetical protein